MAELILWESLGPRNGTVTHYHGVGWHKQNCRMDRPDYLFLSSRVLWVTFMFRFVLHNLLHTNILSKSIVNIKTYFDQPRKCQNRFFPEFWNYVFQRKKQAFQVGMI